MKTRMKIIILVAVLFSSCSDVFNEMNTDIFEPNQSDINPASGDFLANDGVNSSIRVSFSTAVDKKTVSLSGSMSAQAAYSWDGNVLVITPATQWTITASGILALSIDALSGEKITSNLTYNIVDEVIAVHPDGNNANDGSKETPFLTIQAAIDSVTSGVVLVAAGTYSADFDPTGVQTPLVELKNEVSVYGGYDPANWGVRDPSKYISRLVDTSADDATITIKACAVRSNSGVSSSTVFDGFEIQGGSGQYSSGIFIIGSSPVIQNCVINPDNTISTYYGISVYTGGSPLIQYNHIYTGDNTSFTVAMDINNSSNPVIKYNYISAGDYSNTKGVMVQNDSAPLIENNQIFGGDYGNESLGIHVVSGSAPEIKNNFIQAGNDVSSSSCGLKVERASVDAQNNTIYSGTTDSGSTYGISMGNSTGESGLVWDVINNDIRAFAPGSSHLSYGASFYSGASVEVTCEISYNYIYAAETGGVSSTGLSLGTMVSARVINNVIYGGSGTAQTRGIYIGNQAVTESRIWSNTIDGGNGTALSQGIYIGANCTPIFYDNMIFTSGSATEDYGVYEASSSAEPADIRNNDIFDTDTALYHLCYFNGAVVNVDCTTISQTESEVSANTGTNIQNNISEDISDFLSDDMRFTGDLNSVIFDTSGVSIGGWFTDDIDGDFRAGIWSIGAYEYD